MPPTILVLANETIGGARLLDAIRRRHAEEGARFHIVVPATTPRHGGVIYLEHVQDGAQVRVDLTLSFLHEEQIEGTGEVGDQDPYNAALDAIGSQHIDGIIVSTYPAASSGWMRRDLIERLEQQTGLPVEHVEVDINRDGLPFVVTLVVANQTVAGSDLLDRLKALADEGPRRFIVVVPQSSEGRGDHVDAARRRLTALLDHLHEADLVAAGMISHPDPFVAIQQAVQFFHISEIVISTLPENRSEWMKSGLLEKAEKATQKPVIHVESSDVPAAAR